MGGGPARAQRLVDLLGFLSELHTKQVDLYLHQQGPDTSTPAGRAMVSDARAVRRVRAQHDPRKGGLGHSARQDYRREERPGDRSEVLQRPPKTPFAGCWAPARASVPSCGSSASAKALWAPCGPLWPPPVA